MRNAVCLVEYVFQRVESQESVAPTKDEDLAAKPGKALCHLATDWSGADDAKSLR
jgi:hypothetical protein